jgi:hypothetical protein
MICEMLEVLNVEKEMEGKDLDDAAEEVVVSGDPLPLANVDGNVLSKVSCCCCCCCCYGGRMRPQIMKTWDQSFATVLFKHYVSSLTVDLKVRFSTT